MTQGNRLTRIVSGLLLAAIALVGGLWVANTQAQDEPPRTQYDSLNLSTPFDAVTTFIDLLERGDYPAAFLVLSPEAQRAWYESGLAMMYQYWISDPALIDEVTMLQSAAAAEHDLSVAPMLFDEVMRAAEANDAFVIDLRGAADVGGLDQNRDGTATLMARLADDTTATFVLSLSPSGRWRVKQVITSEGDLSVLPWAAVYE